MTELERLQLKEARERESGRVLRRFVGLLGIALFVLILGMQTKDAVLGAVVAVAIAGFALWTLLAERRAKA